MEVNTSTGCSAWIALRGRGNHSLAHVHDCWYNNLCIDGMVLAKKKKTVPWSPHLTLLPGPLTLPSSLVPLPYPPPWSPYLTLLPGPRTLPSSLVPLPYPPPWSPHLTLLPGPLALLPSPLPHFSLPRM